LRIQRINGSLVLVEGRAPTTANWRWRDGQIEVSSPSGKAYAVSPEDVPTDVAIGLLAVRDAQRYPAADATETMGAFAIRTWLVTLHDPLLAGRMGAEASSPSWNVYRFAFFAAASLSPS
jgi:hypothetical protein